jgi:hypothetical protein
MLLPCVLKASARSLYLMGAIMTTDPSESSDLLHRAGQGDAQALGQLLETHRSRRRNWRVSTICGYRIWLRRERRG